MYFFPRKPIIETNQHLLTRKNMSEIVKKFPLTGFATLAAIAVYQGQMIAVGRARHKLKIEAPQTTGNEEFEKVFRAHQNTMESLVVSSFAQHLQLGIPSILVALCIGRKK